ncbi:MAG: c-type cytochrome domain-containing protein [Planctomycetaceae bacterium]
MNGARLRHGGRSASRIAAALLALAAAPAVARAQQPVSFAKQVAPLLAAKCGNCHVAGAKGDFRMPSYEALMQSGMVQRGQGKASRLVEVIVTGDMPRGGGRVAPAELDVLVRWIDAGAACDADPTARLDVVARGGGAPAVPAKPGAPVPPADKPVGAQPLRPGDVAFSADVAPVFLASCAGCHGATKAEGGLRLHTLQALLESKVLEPGQGAASLLVKKLRGADIDGQRMPRGKPPLADDVIARIQKWIDQGARIDLLNAAATLEAVVAAGRAGRLSDAELAVARRKAADVAWRQSLPDEEAAVEVRDRVTVVGNLPGPRLTEVADMAAEVEERVRADLVGRDGRLLKGGMVIFAFRNGYDYSAFWQQVVGGERPKGLTAHAGIVGEAVYGALLVPADDADGATTRLLLAEQICGAALAGRGAPAWFVRGGGRSVAVRLYPKAALAQQWKRDLPAAVREVGPCARFLGGGADPGAAAVAAGGFVGTLASTSAKLKPLLAALDGGTAFDDAFAKAFRTAPPQAYDAWSAKEAARKGPAR